MTQTQPQSQQPQQPSGSTPGLAYIDIDFSAGIHSDLYGNTPATADGAATTNTYGCFSPPAGGLAPLAAPSTDTYDTWSMTPQEIVNGGNVARTGNLPATNDVSRGYGRMFLTDGLVHGPVASGGNPGLPARDVPVALFHYLYNSAGTSAATQYSQYVSFCRRMPFSSPHCSTHELLAPSSARLIVGPGNLAISTSATGTGHRPTILALMGTSIGVTPPCIFYALPNPASPTSTIPYSDALFVDANPGNYIPGVWLIAHQGRLIVVAGDNENAGEFTSEATFYHPEQLFTGAYGHFNIVKSDLTGPQLVVEENPSGIGAWGSISANQIILIKNAGGAVEITGSIDNPTVLRLPGIRSTGGLPSMSASVPGHNFRYPGVVYGTSQGVFMWAGIDNSEALSENLDPLFWLWNRNWPGAVFGDTAYHGSGPTFYGIYGPLGRFAYMHPFLFAPNGYVCDFRSDAWWQIENPTTTVHYTHWHTSAQPHKVWGFKGYVDDTNNLVAQAFDLDTGQSSYYYESHPFKPSRNRYIECREILCSIVGRTGDTVVVTLVGLGGTKTSTMTLTQNGLSMFRLDTSLRASFVQAQITSTSNNSDAAPRVLALSVGYKPQTILNG